MKMLFCASTVSHIMNFHLPYLKAFKEAGHEIHVVADRIADIPYADKVYACSFKKNLMSFQNMRAIFQCRHILKTENYDKLSSNTTLAGVIIRISALLLKKRPRIYHIVHGYLFNSEQGFEKYVYLIPEKVAAFVSDVVAVMNHQDFETAQKYKLYKGRLVYINGMGVDLSRYSPTTTVEKLAYRQQLGLPRACCLFTYVAELSKRKNQEFLIRAFGKANLNDAILVLAGDGSQMESYKQLINQLNLSNRVQLIGYTTNVATLYAASDVVVSSSKIEGLPFNLVEAIGSGLPVVASDIKGHRELIDDHKNGYLYKSGDMAALENALMCAYEMDENTKSHFQNYSLEKVQQFALTSVYNEVMCMYTCE